MSYDEAQGYVVLSTLAQPLLAAIRFDLEKRHPWMRDLVPQTVRLALSRLG